MKPVYKSFSFVIHDYNIKCASEHELSSQATNIVCVNRSSVFSLTRPRKSISDRRNMFAERKV